MEGPGFVEGIGRCIGSSEGSGPKEELEEGVEEEILILIELSSGNETSINDMRLAAVISNMPPVIFHVPGKYAPLEYVSLNFPSVENTIVSGNVVLVVFPMDEADADKAGGCAVSPVPEAETYCGRAPFGVKADNWVASSVWFAIL